MQKDSPASKVILEGASTLTPPVIGSVEKALAFLQKQKPLERDSYWKDHSGHFTFGKNKDGWYWTMNPFIPPTYTTHCFFAIQNEMKTLKRSGFATLKETTQYLEALCGKDTEYGFSFQRLYNGRIPVYDLRPFFLEKNRDYSGSRVWQAGVYRYNKFRTSSTPIKLYPKDLGRENSFQTRREALQCLFDRELIL